MGSTVGSAISFCILAATASVPGSDRMGERECNQRLALGKSVIVLFNRKDD
ncbi:hypothetical protein ACHAWO_009285 [Cyclotella atomus]|jgi:hypothetical protein|uniref:Uncharacterized protein n=1 Tax=Cyclotella atomus TaxID=382360 RepID=A0ABD3NG68_9STRA